MNVGSESQLFKRFYCGMFRNPAKAMLSALPLPHYYFWNRHLYYESVLRRPVRTAMRRQPPTAVGDKSTEKSYDQRDHR
jgi:hypothetical protein